MEMSTYLLAMIVCDFAQKNGTTSGGVRLFKLLKLQLGKVYFLEGVY